MAAYSFYWSDDDWRWEEEDEAADLADMDNMFTVDRNVAEFHARSQAPVVRTVDTTDTADAARWILVSVAAVAACAAVVVVLLRRARVFSDDF